MMDWWLILEIAFVVIALGISIYKTIVAIKEGQLLPIVLGAIEEAEAQDGLTGEEKLNYALDYIKREANLKGVKVDLPKVINLITELVALTKKVNFK